jgi:hypothetical protein
MLTATPCLYFPNIDVNMSNWPTLNAGSVVRQVLPLFCTKRKKIVEILVLLTMQQQ